MTLVVLGLNHKTAPVAVREKFAYGSAVLAEGLCVLVAHPFVNEAMALSTCNRTELYTDASDQEVVKKWLQSCWQLSDEAFNNYVYCFVGEEAVLHMMRVAVGLDSMMLGEPEILGQMKKAFQLACQIGSVGPQLKRLLQDIFAASKHVRSETAIGKNSMSLASVCVQLAQKFFVEMTQCRVLLIGSGEIMRLVAVYLQSCGISDMVVASRSDNQISTWPTSLSVNTLRLAEVPDYLAQVDIVISGTASPLPIIGKSSVQAALLQRNNHPILMVDLAVPRDMEDAIKQLDHVYLYNIDDLQQVVEHNMQSRQQAAKDAMNIIDIRAQTYMRELRIRNASRMIDSFRQQHETMRDEQLRYSLAKLRAGGDPEKVLQDCTHRLTNKILHQPTRRLRQAAADEKIDWLRSIEQLFELETL